MKTKAIVHQTITKELTKLCKENKDEYDSYEWRNFSKKISESMIEYLKDTFPDIGVEWKNSMSFFGKDNPFPNIYFIVVSFDEDDESQDRYYDHNNVTGVSHPLLLDRYQTLLRDPSVVLTDDIKNQLTEANKLEGTGFRLPDLLTKTKGELIKMLQNIGGY